VDKGRNYAGKLWDRNAKCRNSMATVSDFVDCIAGRMLNVGEIF